jgi:four helix bundle protein
MEFPNHAAEDDWSALEPAELANSQEDDSFSVNEDGEQYAVAKRPFDLEERTTQFGAASVRFCKKVPLCPTNNRLIDQLVGAATSVGANYMEASERVSKRDFVFIISRCVKEAKEARFFLRMIAVSEPELAPEARALYKEASELLLILAKIRRVAGQSS